MNASKGVLSLITCKNLNRLQVWVVYKSCIKLTTLPVQQVNTALWLCV